MSSNPDFNAIFDRIVNHQQTKSDIQFLQQSISAGDDQSEIQIGNYIVNIAEGRNIHIGDVIYEGISAEAIRDLLRLILQESQTQKPISRPANIPYIGVPKFVGREKELTNLHEQLQQPPTFVILAVAGMGGVGKTELAIKYARKHEADYPGGTCWLNAIEKNVVEAEIVQFASQHMSLKVPKFCK